MEKRKMHEEDCRRVWTVNTWREEQKAEARGYLEAGYWVHFGSTAIGLTRALMTEANGIEWVRKEYGDTVRVAENEEDGKMYVRLR